MIEGTRLCAANLHEISSGSGYCLTCAKCDLCLKQLTVAEYEWNLRNNAKNEGLPRRMEHPACLRQEERLELASESVTVTRSTLDKLNAARLLIEPNMSWGIDTNQQDAQFAAQRLMHMMSTEQVVVMLARLESVCAALTLATRKDRKPIEIRIKQKQAEDFKAANAARNAPKVPKTTLKVEKRQLTKEDKAVQALMNIGLSEEEARESVNRKKVS